MKDLVIEAFLESAKTKVAFAESSADRVVAVAKILAGAFRQGGKALVFGNGGSAADAQHFASELVNRFQINRSPLPAIALTTDASILTSIANDYDFGEVFSRQIEALGRPGDVAVALSTSGRSVNVLRAVETARKEKLGTIGLTGGEGGDLAAAVDQALVVPSDVVARIQETHLALIHVICMLVDRLLFSENSSPQSG